MGKSKLAVRINPAGESIPDFLPQICFLSSQASVFKYHLAGYLQHRAQNQQLLSGCLSCCSYVYDGAMKAQKQELLSDRNRALAGSS